MAAAPPHVRGCSIATVGKRRPIAALASSRSTGRRPDRLRAAAPIAVRVHTGFEALPEALQAFLGEAGARNFFHGMPWFRALLQGTGPADDRLRIYAAEHDGRPIAVLVTRERAAAGRLRARTLLSPSQGATAAVYAPLLDGALGAAGLRAIAAAMVRERPRIAMLRFDGLDRGAPEFAQLVGAFRRTAMPMQRFFNYRQRFEVVRGLTWPQYVARRPPPLREAIERHLRQPFPSPELRFEIMTGGPGLAAALIDYALVDLQSGFALEPYPELTLQLARVAADSGVLRLALLYVEDEPAAAQIWLIAGGTATLWRSRHAERFAGREVDIRLMAAVLQHLFETGRLDEIEFARDVGDHGADWLAAIRERTGLAVFNPRTARGLLLALRHIGGHIAKALARRARRLAPLRTIRG